MASNLVIITHSFLKDGKKQFVYKMKKDREQQFLVVFICSNLYVPTDMYVHVLWHF